LNQWSIFYERAIRDDGSLFFPERLSKEFLESQRGILGSYIYANQYQNEIIPLEDRRFKPEWLRYYLSLPERSYTFAFIDPAISQADTADFSGITVIQVSEDKKWYLRLAERRKITPTEIVDLVFALHNQFNCQAIGIEDVAYQKALLYMIAEESLRRGKNPPVKGIHPGTKNTKETRIMGLIPRFEWGRIEIAHGLVDFEKEYLEFPRSSHDDIMDSLSQLEQLVFYPGQERISDHEAPGTIAGEIVNPNHPDYESWYRRTVYKRIADEENG
jgi:predicted phage terminase large subunit-like protein